MIFRHILRLGCRRRALAEVTEAIPLLCEQVREGYRRALLWAIGLARVATGGARAKSLIPNRIAVDIEHLRSL